MSDKARELPDNPGDHEKRTHGNANRDPLLKIVRAKDPKKPETYGLGGPSEKLKAEFNDTPHRRGIVSMARTNDPNSAGSQFFIVVKDSNFLDGQYTVFGEVVKGMDVADKIVNLPRNRNDLPTERVEITVAVE